MSRGCPARSGAQSIMLCAIPIAAPGASSRRTAAVSTWAARRWSSARAAARGSASPGGKNVEGMSRAVRREVHHVVRDSDRRPGRFLAKDDRRLHVGREEMVERARGGARVGESGRDLTVEKAPEEDDERFV